MWESLRNILTAYAAHDPVMGYVQSMNFIAAFLLLAGLAEEDAFWCLVALVDRVVPGYFSEGMAAAKLDQRLFTRFLHIHLPAVGLHLESLAPDNIVAGSSPQGLTPVNVLPPKRPCGDHIHHESRARSSPAVSCYWNPRVWTRVSGRRG